MKRALPSREETGSSITTICLSVHRFHRTFHPVIEIEKDRKWRSPSLRRMLPSCPAHYHVGVICHIALHELKTIKA
jgi:hypothetical protein